MAEFIQPGGYSQEPQQQLQPPAQFDLNALMGRNQRAGETAQRMQDSPYAFQRQMHDQVLSMYGLNQQQLEPGPL